MPHWSIRCHTTLRCFPIQDWAAPDGLVERYVLAMACVGEVYRVTKKCKPTHWKFVIGNHLYHFYLACYDITEPVKVEH
jgi:hypothetical protein